MAEKRLIDANALLALVADDLWAYEVEQFEHYVSKAPTVDAVEVVRCKDCKFGEWCSTHRYKTQDGNTAEMSLYECLVNRSQRRWHAGTHFCSHGERRTDG